MGIMFYEPPPPAADEARREKAVEASRALLARDDGVLCEIVAEARRRFHAFTAAVSIVYGDYQYLIAASGIPTGLYARRTSLCGHAVAGNDRIYQVPDTRADPRFAGNPWVHGEEGHMAFYAAALLRDGEGQALGALCITDVKPRAPLDAVDNSELLRFAGRALDRLDCLRSGDC